MDDEQRRAVKPDSRTTSSPRSWRTGCTTAARSRPGAQIQAGLAAVLSRLGVRLGFWNRGHSEGLARWALGSLHLPQGYFAVVTRGKAA